jgi:uncharacterized protein YgiM (DUF1202 family)
MLVSFITHSFSFSLSIKAGDVFITADEVNDEQDTTTTATTTAASSSANTNTSASLLSKFQYEVVADTVDVHCGPGDKYITSSHLKKGDIVTGVTEEKKGWAKYGTCKWVPVKDLVEKKVSESAAKTKSNASLTTIKESLSDGTTLVSKASDQGAKVVNAVASAESTLTQTIAAVNDQLANLEFEVTAEKLNVRSGPSTDRIVVTQLKKGDKVTGIIEQQDGWVKYGTAKWVSTKYLKAVNTDAAQESATAAKKTIKTSLKGLKSLFKSLID